MLGSERTSLLKSSGTIEAWRNFRHCRCLLVHSSSDSGGSLPFENTLRGTRSCLYLLLSTDGGLSLLSRYKTLRCLLGPSSLTREAKDRSRALGNVKKMRSSAYSGQPTHHSPWLPRGCSIPRHIQKCRRDQLHQRWMAEDLCGLNFSASGGEFVAISVYLSRMRKLLVHARFGIFCCSAMVRYCTDT